MPASGDFAPNGDDQVMTTFLGAQKILVSHGEVRTGREMMMMHDA